MFVPLDDAPEWAVQAGVDYANDEWDGEDRVTITTDDGTVRVGWTKVENVDMTATREQGTLEVGGGDLELRYTEGTAEAFREELERRNDD